jgi:hypothetical protein
MVGEEGAIHGVYMRLNPQAAQTRVTYSLLPCLCKHIDGWSISMHTTRQCDSQTYDEREHARR